MPDEFDKDAQLAAKTRSASRYLAREARLLIERHTMRAQGGTAHDTVAEREHERARTDLARGVELVEQARDGADLLHRAVERQRVDALFERSKRQKQQKT